LNPCCNNPGCRRRRADPGRTPRAPKRPFISSKLAWTRIRTSLPVGQRNCLWTFAADWSNPPSRGASNGQRPAKALEQGAKLAAPLWPGGAGGSRRQFADGDVTPQAWCATEMLVRHQVHHQDRLARRASFLRIFSGDAEIRLFSADGSTEALITRTLGQIHSHVRGHFPDVSDEVISRAGKARCPDYRTLSCLCTPDEGFSVSHLPEPCQVHRRGLVLRADGYQLVVQELSSATPCKMFLGLARRVRIPRLSIEY